MNPYKIIIATTSSELEKNVNKAIAEGFVPQGGISALQRGSSELFVQAVVSNKMQGARK